MPNYRRAYIPGGTFFFTVVTHERRRLFHLEHNRVMLGDSMRQCKSNWPFGINAIVLLPDHLHTIWTLPQGGHKFLCQMERDQEGIHEVLSCRRRYRSDCV